MSLPIRLSKVMADRGICSRREADECIAKGWVKVNGKVVSELGSKINPKDEITLTEDAAAWLRGKLSIIIYKPVGHVSGQAEEDYEAASYLITEENQVRAPGDPGAPSRRDLQTLAPAGRLDIDSRGLLLLSQDGKLVRKIIAPDSNMEKEYLVWVEGNITGEKIQRLRHGLSLDGKALKPAFVEQIKDQQLRFILREGKKRQIRRMCELVNLDVTSLVRIRIGPLKLGNLEPAQWRYLSRNEQFSLMKEESRSDAQTLKKNESTSSTPPRRYVAGSKPHVDDRRESTSPRRRPAGTLKAYPKKNKRD